MKRAFTLVEVLTVVLIIGILATITTYSYGSSLARSRDYQRLTDMQSVKNTLDQFYLDNRAYPKNHFTTVADAIGYPWVAQFQLEKYPSGSNCASTQVPKDYLTPRYITALPEDPKNKLALNVDCKMEPPPNGRPVGHGQYLYVGLVANQVDQPVDYVLFARMERKNNVSEQKPSVSDLRKYPYSAGIIDIGNGSTGMPYNYCDKRYNNPTGPICDFNYFARAGSLPTQ